MTVVLSAAEVFLFPFWILGLFGISNLGFWISWLFVASGRARNQGINRYFTVFPRSCPGKGRGGVKKSDSHFFRPDNRRLPGGSLVLCCPSVTSRLG